MATNDQDNIPPIPVPPVEATPVVPAPPAAATAPPYTPAPEPVYGPPTVQPIQPAQATYSTAYTPQPAGPAQGLSIASLVCGIGGLVFTLFGFGFLPALAGVILGHMAQKRQPWAKGLWLTGLITGYVGVAIGLVAGAVILIGIIALVLGTSGMYVG